MKKTIMKNKCWFKNEESCCFRLWGNVFPIRFCWLSMNLLQRAFEFRKEVVLLVASKLLKCQLKQVYVQSLTVKTNDYTPENYFPENKHARGKSIVKLGSFCCQHYHNFIQSTYKVTTLHMYIEIYVHIYICEYTLDILPAPDCVILICHSKNHHRL